MQETTPPTGRQRRREIRRKIARKVLPARFHARISAVSWRDLAVTLGPFLLFSVLLIAAVITLLDPAPPKTITISSGPEGSAFHKHAEKYRKILARNGITLVVLKSEGSLENLDRLSAGKVDLGFVIDGITPAGKADQLVSLGSISHQPMFMFYRGKETVGKLTELAGKRVSIGRVGSGARVLALALFKANGIDQGGTTQLRGLEAEDAVEALLAGEIDAAFLMGDSASLATMRKLMFAADVHLLNLSQAEAYTRRIPSLGKLTLPMGAIDLARNIPSLDIALVAPNVELLARESLHPALSDLLIDAAREVHGRRGLLQEAGEFPVAQSSDFRLSDDADRYYKFGKGFFYRHLPFWLASLLDRIVILVLPIAVLLIPAIRLLPWLYRWRIHSRIYPWYGALMALERGLLSQPIPEDRGPLLARLDEIEQGVNKLTVPLAFIDQIYVLREHIAFVRARLAADGLGARQ
ncbi:C4-dicarboxylate ABC transporter substrate-binding protein [Chitinimonas arctica]|uniref:C4-dicarboxylate ABC transporter substrate-binding protein n=1 Tax=Chitinimonas arctica TaxID=2594795 RepID=A0A516SA79_9NEIS|nr:TAXI family TRAP transporter solute-binding subunit [Chitinimonas arctica]QDQ25053.1 C4-dicarboxylate ABC transporter substrate-binding protein [Chitinimonas arctica]